MAAAPAVMAAFQTGAGLSGASAHDVLVVVLAALTLLWLAWALAGIGTRVLDQRLTHHQAGWYAARALVLAMLVVFYLVR